MVVSKMQACSILELALILASYSAALEASFYRASRGGTIGVDYGLNGDNLLAPEETVKLIRSKGIKRVRTYEARPDVIQAFAHTGIDLTVGIPNEEVPKLAANLGEAFSWVTKYVIAFPASGISTILVGNEWLSDPSNDPSLLVPAMQHIYTALSTLQLFDECLRGIKVSSSHSFALLTSPSFPPSTATFADTSVPVMRPLLDFLDKSGSFFVVNIFPYFAYLADDKVSLEFALFESTETVTDPNTGLQYSNLFDLQLDAVYAAIASLLSSSSNVSQAANTSDERVHSEATPARRRPPPPRGNQPGIKVQAGETGWSSNGGSADTPPSGRPHAQFFPSKHPITRTSSLSEHAQTLHNHLNRQASLQNTTLTRSATLPSATQTSSPSPLSHETSVIPSSFSPPSSRLSSPTTPSFSSSVFSSLAISSSTVPVKHATTAQVELEAARCTCSAATVENAETYNQNLIRHVLQAKGTPAHPNTPISVYIFALFNEDLKPAGPEQHFGLFFPNGTAVYPIIFNEH